MRKGWALFLAMFVPVAARADEQVWKQQVAWPADDVEHLAVDNRLGSVTVRGWDRSEVQITATKRAAPEILSRLRVHMTKFDDGRMVIDTRVKLEAGELILPLGAGRVDLTIDAPRGVRLGARTWSGDLAAAGMRGGARLETEAGRIDVSDVTGAVVARGRRSNQHLTLIRGDVDVDDLEGDVILQQITGDRIVAHLLRGTIRADRLLARTISLEAMIGRVEFVLGENQLVELRARARGGRVVVGGQPQEAGMFRGMVGMRSAAPASRVELISYGGDVLVQLVSARF